MKEFLGKKGKGVQHLGLEVEDLEENVRELEFRRVEVPVRQFEGDGRKEALVSLKNTFGTVIQLIEWGVLISHSMNIAKRMRKYHLT